MLPEFPCFEPFDLSHAPHMDSALSSLLPYSDFNFTSLYCWNTGGHVACSNLHGNTAVRFSDYLTGRPFYSFIGTSRAEETAEALLSLMQTEGIPPEIKLLPETVAKTIRSEKFVVEEDPDNFDYVLSIERLRSYDGSRLKTNRNAVNRFRRSFRSETRLLDLADPSVREILMSGFAEWVKRKGLSDEEALNERCAFSNVFTLAKHRHLVCVGVFVCDVLAGFTISERLPSSWAMVHFEKADPARFPGIYAHLMQETAHVLASDGCQLLNYQQDLGIPGLKMSKKDFHPTSHLRKYRVRWKGVS
jgi:hypothetical protein